MKIDEKKIMIVEDNHSLNDLYSLKFKKEWFLVKSYYDWLWAIIDLEWFAPDLIVLDIMMPSIDGIEVLETIKQKHNTAKVIVFSNITNQKDIDRIKELWADEFAPKSNYSPKEIVDIAKNLLWLNSTISENDEWHHTTQTIITCPCCNNKIKITLEQI